MSAEWGQPLLSDLYCGREVLMSDREQLVRTFRQAFDEADFDAAADLMIPDAVVRWPCTGETFRGTTNFVDVQRHYPGRWRIAVEKVVVAAVLLCGWRSLRLVAGGAFARLGPTRRSAQRSTSTTRQPEPSRSLR
jgi:hypothetical protein